MARKPTLGGRREDFTLPLSCPSENPGIRRPGLARYASRAEGGGQPTLPPHPHPTLAPHRRPRHLPNIRRVAPSRSHLDCSRTMTIHSPNTAVLRLRQRSRKTGPLAGPVAVRGADVSSRRSAEPSLTIASSSRWPPGPHHSEFGSKLLATSLPEYALITVGTRHSKRYPCPIVSARPRRMGGGMLRTDTRGKIVVIAYRDGSVTARRKRKRCSTVPRTTGFGYFVQSSAVAIQRSSRLLDLGNA